MSYTQIRQNFEKHGFSTQLFPQKEDAVAYLAAILDKQTISFGGSVTLLEMGLYEALAERNAVVWHKIGSPPLRYDAWPAMPAFI